MSRRGPLQHSFAAAMSVAMALYPAVAGAETAAATDGAQAMRINSGRSGANAASLVLPFGKSAIVDLPADARDVLLSNPQIADAVVRTPRRVYIVGRALGQTNAFFFDANGAQIASVDIRVEPDVGPLNEILRRQSPDTNISAEAMNASIVLSGTVKSAAEADRAYQLATTFLGIAGGSGAGSSGGNGAAAGGPNSPGIGSSGGNQPRVINMIQVEGSEQVLVRVRVVEMTRSLVRQLGINLNYSEMVNQLLSRDAFADIATANGFSISGRLLGGLSASGGVAHNILSPSSVTYPSGGVDPSIGVGSAGVGGYEVSPIQDSSGAIVGSQTTYGSAEVNSDRQTDASIEAFERAGLLRILAEPNLTAISGEPARFLAGGEFPVPVAQNDGQMSVEFKPFGVGLAFTPVVLSGGRISLKLETEVSDISSEGAISTGDTPIRNSDGTTTVIRGVTIPALQVRRAQTTLEMPSGGSIVLAGLIQERTRHALEGLPGIMNTPVLGALFRSRDFVNSETELVIIVTPYLVHSTSRDNLRTPADGFRNASEGESVLTGRLNALYRTPDGDDADRPRLQGPHGHVIE